MTTQTSTVAPTIALPSTRTLRNLFIGGYCALMAWEIWARTITAWVGGPLEPPELVRSLVQHWTGAELSLATATFLHYAVGIFGYPIAYFVISRSFRRWGPALDLGVLGIFSAYLAWRFAHTGFETNAAIFWAIVAATTATRLINPSELHRDALSWGSFTWFNALGIMAPLAGLPFLLLDGALLLSFMSWAGHVLFGYVAVMIFERLEARI
ncbi:MAG: hypothetical protein H6870_05695 [Methylobacteriaceae bacterium]|nr:hypothetical protein [Methylobacteriaceae bacterium]